MTKLFNKKVSLTLTQLPSQENIDLSGQFIDSRSFDDLASMSKGKSYPSVKTLDLSCNTFKIESILLFLKSFPSLKSLDLSYSGIEDEGAHSLAKILASHPYLENLDLKGNYIEDDSADALKSAQARHSSLTIINLEGNNIEEDFLEADEAESLYSIKTKIEHFHDSEVQSDAESERLWDDEELFLPVIGTAY